MNCQRNFLLRKHFQIRRNAGNFPLQNFQFEGLVVVEVNDVTQEQVIVEMKTALLNINSFSDVSIYDQLQQHVQSLIGSKNVKIGITPFFKLNDCYLYTEALYKNSILFKNEEVVSERNQVGEICDDLFEYPTNPFFTKY